MFIKKAADDGTKHVVRPINMGSDCCSYSKAATPRRVIIEFSPDTDSKEKLFRLTGQIAIVILTATLK